MSSRTINPLARNDRGEHASTRSMGRTENSRQTVNKPSIGLEVTHLHKRSKPPEFLGTVQDSTSFSALAWQPTVGSFRRLVACAQRKPVISRMMDAHAWTLEVHANQESDTCALAALTLAVR
jgi:hypothetical protein